MTVFLTPDGEPFFGGTYFPPEPRHGLPAFRRCCSRSPRPGATSATRSSASGAALADAHPRAARALQPSGEPLADGAPRRRAQREPARGVRPALGRLRPRAEVPAGAGARAPAAARRGGDDAAHARRDGGRRHVRPRRRRLPPLLGRRALARPALREDALRQRAARLGLPARGEARSATTRYRAVAERTLDYVLRELALDGGRLRLGAGRRHRRRRGPDVHLGAGRGRARRAARSRSRTAASSLRGELDDETRAAPARDAREQRPQPLRDDKAIASWNGLVLAALAQGGRARAGRCALAASSCSARSRRPTAGCTARGATASPKGTGYLEDYADVAYGLHGAARRDRRAALAARGAPAGDARGRAVRRRRGAAASSRRRPTASSSSRAKKELDDHPTPSGNAMLAYVLLRLARIWGDDELERRGGLRPAARARRACAQCPTRVRLDARRAPPAPRAAPRARDRRRRRTRRSRAARARRARRRPT